MNNKKGLSGLVSTVLIVLLALAAVAIIWGFLRPAIQDTGSQTNLKAKCFDVDIQPVKCASTSTSTSLTVRLMGGEVVAVTGIFEDVANVRQTNRTSAPGVLETKVITLNGNFAEAGVAAVVSDGSKEEICQASVMVPCTTAS